MICPEQIKTALAAQRVKAMDAQPESIEPFDVSNRVLSMNTGMNIIRKCCEARIDLPGVNQDSASCPAGEGHGRPELIEPFDVSNRVLSMNTGMYVIRKWCPDSESNQGHEDFQSSALPTELSGLFWGVDLLGQGAY